jgi:hypothetical protein
VDDPGFVRSRQRVGDLEAVLERLIERELAPRDTRGERLPPPGTP